MTIQNVDFSNAGTVRNLIPKGFYEAQCIEVNLEISKNSGNQMLKFDFITCMGSISQFNAIGAGDNNKHLKHTLVMLGYPESELAGNSNIDTDRVLNVRCAIRVDHEESTFNGRPVTNARIGQMFKQNDPQLQFFNVMALGSVAAETNHVQQQQANKSTAYTPPTDISPEDDIPF